MGGRFSEGGCWACRRRRGRATGAGARAAPSRRVPVTASGRHRQRRRHGSGARARQRRPRRGCVLLCSARREESRGIGAWLVWGQGRARARPHRVQVKSPNHFANLAGIIISKHLYTPWCDWFSFLFQTNYSLRP